LNMAHPDLIDAFNACIDCLHAGGQLEDCLRAYPYYADSLRPMLEVGLRVQRANPSAAPGARARTRARVMQAVARAAPTRRLSTTLQRFGLAAASLLIVVVVALLIQRIDRSPSGDVQITALPSLTTMPTATATASPTATATATASPTATPSPTASPTMTQTNTATLTLLPTQQPLAPAPTLQPCQFTVQSSSVNLRSGPGTGYGVVGYGYNGEVYPVLARHMSNQWFTISAAGESVWIAANVGSLTGECSDLEISNEPLLEGALTGDAADDDGNGSGSGDDGSGDDGGGSGSGDDDSSGSGSGDDDHGDTHDDDSSGSGSGGDDEPDVEPDDD
jgi:hypothetical protein